MSKSKNFTTTQQRLAAQAKALAHPARIAILAQLAGDTDCRRTELDLPLARATVAQHLEILVKAGLIRGTTSGRSLCYCVDRKELAGLARDLGSFLDELDKSLPPDASPKSCEPGCY